MRMTAAELRLALARLRLSPAEAAQLLGVSGVTMRRWLDPAVAAKRPVPETCYRLLDLIEHVPGVWERLLDVVQQRKGWRA